MNIMILTIEPIQIEQVISGYAPTCFYDVIASVCNYYSINYEMMFSGSWQFNYNIDKSFNFANPFDRIIFDNNELVPCKA